jgi:HemY protein
MTRLLIYAILAAVGVALVLGLQSHGGAVTIWWSEWRLDLSLSTALFALAGLFIAHLVLTRVLGWLMDIPARVRRSQARRAELRRLKALADLALDFHEGRFARVMKSAEDFQAQFGELQEAQRPVSRLVSVMAARAAHELRDPLLRKRWLARLSSEDLSKSDHPHLLALTEAQFALDEHQPVAALESLEGLMRGERRQIHTMRLLTRAYQLGEQWEDLIRITKLLENRHAISHLVADHNREMAVRGLLKKAAADATAVRRVSDLLSREDLHQPGVAMVVSTAHLAAGRPGEARRLIEAALREKWDDRLLPIYADCDDNVGAQLAQMEEWSRQQVASHEMHLALGRLYHRAQQMGKAGVHLEQAVAARTSTEALLALAQWADDQGDAEAARRHWRQAASLRSTALARSAARQY